MTNSVYGRGFTICAYWERRAETPDALAARFVRTIDSLQVINPVFALWTCVSKRRKRFETVRDNYAKEVAAGIIRDDWGKPEPIQGYRFGAFTRDQLHNRTFELSVRAGSTYPGPFPNDIKFYTRLGCIPDPAAVAYEIFKPALLAIVEAWDPVCAMSCPDILLKRAPANTYFHESWFQYLCPWLASLVTPPSSAIVERLANGGLLMSARRKPSMSRTPRIWPRRGPWRRRSCPSTLSPGRTASAPERRQWNETTAFFSERPRDDRGRAARSSWPAPRACRRAARHGSARDGL